VSWTVRDSLILPADVLVVAVTDLPADIRDRLSETLGSWIVGRPRARSLFQLLDEESARLLEAFRAPATIADAVIALSREQGRDAHQTLDDMLEVLRRLLDDELLVPAGSSRAQDIVASLAPGRRVATFEIVEPLQVLDDTEVYVARTARRASVAVKLAREGAEDWLCERFHHEADVLARLDGRVNPRLVQRGDMGGRPFLALSWCAGIDVNDALLEAHEVGRAEVLRLGAELIAAYGHLHAQGVLHGDVHPGNVLVDSDGHVTVVDYGLAQAEGCEVGWRGGSELFMEPEAAAALLAEQEAPPVTAAGEQYSVAALAYLVVTGAHTHAFSLEVQETRRQVAEDPPLPFAEHGVEGLPEVERVLARALAKRPEERFASVEELLQAFREAAARDSAATPPAAPWRRSAAAEELLDRVLERAADPASRAAPPAPREGMTTVHDGPAGIALALLRIAAVREDPALLAAADLWAVHAGRAEPAPAGAHWVQALVARGRADEPAQEDAVGAFLATCAAASRAPIAVANGRAGLLLAHALLLEALPATLDATALEAAGDQLRDGLWEELRGRPPIADDEHLRALGVAHGWAGVVHALLRWSEATATPLPPGLDARLEQLADLAQPSGRGLRWPRTAGEPASANPLDGSWCDGGAGFVHLWALAHRLTGDDAFGRLAELAAWTAYSALDDSGDLHCGLAGRAYALLAAHRLTDDDRWLIRARELADRAALAIEEATLTRDSLFRGEVGVALLAAELERPQDARMPLVEAEGWPRRSRAQRRPRSQATPAST
jgi:eukaryotic-like serine/threonine-protein kinase